ncbi:MAG TPA: type IV toxin-antitoxin system AbiEi family antitoxin domain-containing protein [Acidimicrobiia bacterium]|jgi:very-short-patch-repair endonuclease
MVTPKDRAVADLAARQHGRFTAAQARGLGFDDHHREYRVRSGRWESPHPGVYRIAGMPETWHGSVLECCWAVHGIATASHRSAAALWDLPGARRDLVEITCARWHRGFVPGLVVHETKSLWAEDLEEIDGIPVTGIEQTLLGLAAVSPAVLEMALDRALHRKLTTRARLDAFVGAKGARGRNGIGVLRRLVVAHDPFAGVPESAMETRLKQLLRRHGLPTPEFQYVIRHQDQFIARVDAAYPELRIAIEFDSYEHHTGKDALVRDTDRRNRLLQIRWQSIAFTAADLRRNGGPAIEALVAARRSLRP